jgi:exonuclease III
MVKTFKTYLLVSILVLFSGVLNAETFSITTFNAEFLSWSNIHVKEGYSFRLDGKGKAIWNNKKRTETFNKYAAKTAEFLLELDSDVFIITEGGTAADIRVLFDFMSEENREYEFFFAGVTRDYYTRQNIWVISKYKISNIEKQLPGKELYITEPDGGEENTTEISKGVSCDVQKGRYTFKIFGVHFISEVGGYEKDLQRLGQARILRRNILNTAPEKIVIVAGDLNDVPRSNVLYTIRGINDIYFDLLQTGHYRYNKGIRETYTYQNIGRQIDHILLDCQIEDFTKRGGIDTYVTPTPLSDHNAVTVKISLK